MYFNLVEADTGYIGGHRSQELHIPVSLGEEEILHCAK